MQIETKALHIIDYERENVYRRDIPQAFDEYVRELIAYVEHNNSVRMFKSKSTRTEVLSCIKAICQNVSDADMVDRDTSSVAERLLHKEIEAQKKVARMNTSVQKGSLIQALLANGDEKMYLLAKVEHSDFVDDVDFTFKSGFSKDKKKIWKTCLIDVSDIDAKVFLSKIYSDTVAQYWSHDFLEFEEMVNDETNTTNAFKAIDQVLNRNVKNVAPRDYTVIRNSVISYFRNNEHVDYEDLVNAVLGEGYQPADYPEDKVTLLREKLEKLPEEKQFDRQFNSKPEVLSARIRKIYEVNTGIQLKISREIKDLSGTITSYREDDGTRYIRIKTNNDITYQCFHSKE